MLEHTENRANQTESSPEVLEKPMRRRFTAAYKIRIIEEADRCIGSGKLGQLLRRKGCIRRICHRIGSVFGSKVRCNR